MLYLLFITIVLYIFNISVMLHLWVFCQVDKLRMYGSLLIMNLIMEHELLFVFFCSNLFHDLRYVLFYYFIHDLGDDDASL